MTVGEVVPSQLDSSGDPSFTCSNVVKEVAYTVEVSSVDEPDVDVSKTAYLKIDKISADIVLQDG